MGQQQLLLIVLSLILVGIAVVVGLQIFSASNRTSAIDALSSDLHNLESMAIADFNKPLLMGGLGRNFQKWKIPKKLKIVNDREYHIGARGTNELTIWGVSLDKSTGIDKKNGVKCAININIKKKKSVTFGIKN